MSQQTPGQEIERLLEDLRSGGASRRKEAAESLGKLGVSDERIANALKTAASEDYNETVRSAAKTALAALGQDVSSLVETRPAGSAAPTPSRYVYTTRNQKIIHFAIGFVGWYVIAGLIWGVIAISLGQGDMYIVPLCLSLLINVVALLAFGFTRRWIALGLLVALAVNLVTTLVMGVMFNGLCFIPFFIQDLPGFSHLLNSKVALT